MLAGQELPPSVGGMAERFLTRSTSELRMSLHRSSVKATLTFSVVSVSAAGAGDRS